MDSAWRRLLSTTVICLAVAFGFFLLLAMFAVDSDSTLDAFKWQWILNRAWADLLELAPVVQAWAAIIVFSVIIPSTAGSAVSTSFQRFGSSIVVLLAMTILFTVVYGLWFPQARGRMDEITLTTGIARALGRSAEDAEAAQQYERAVELWQQYVVLVGPDEEIEKRSRELRDQARTNASRAQSDSAALSMTTAVGPTAEELVDRARVADADEDYSTAHYMATLAVSLDPQLLEARTIAAESHRRMEESGPDSQEQEAYDLYRAKQRAKKAIGDGQYIAAYHQLFALSEANPRDIDIARYLVIAEDAVRDLAVFRDEVETALQAPGSDLMVVNAVTDGETELVYFGKLVQTKDGLFGFRIEVVRFTSEGRIVSHFSSDYGKLVEDHLVLRIVDRDGSERITFPTLHSVVDDPGIDGILELSLSADELVLLSHASRSPSSASVADLRPTLRAMHTSGQLAETVQLEMLVRLAVPFGYVIVSLLSLGFAWRFRSRYVSRPPIPALVLIVAIPFAGYPLYLFFRFAHRVVLSSFLLWVGFSPALILLIVVEAILLIISLIYVALGTQE